ncbi:hypothetical protein VNO78_30498 [Psophocarpus tetragonolobus]|uniref:S-protein homolog n=1 Tax=Psophocarpus tetragonolobus TaxID=3891 RepID=A0AAN9X5D7_PSOTE
MVLISKIVLINLVMLMILSLQLQDGESKLLSSKATDSAIWPEVTVTIINHLDMRSLGLHCKDKNHDLGSQMLNVGETYTFKFHPNLFRKVSLYFCKFVWPEGNHYFDIYVEERDGYCEAAVCAWEILASGPCKIKHSSQSRECFPWNQTP